MGSEVSALPGMGGIFERRKTTGISSTMASQYHAWTHDSVSARPVGWVCLLDEEFHPLVKLMML